MPFCHTTSFALVPSGRSYLQRNRRFFPFFLQLSHSIQVDIQDWQDHRRWCQSLLSLLPSSHLNPIYHPIYCIQTLKYGCTQPGQCGDLVTSPPPKLLESPRPRSRCHPLRGRIFGVGWGGISVLQHSMHEAVTSPLHPTVSIDRQGEHCERDQ